MPSRMDSDRVARAAVAAEELCGTLWETIREQVRAGSAGEVAAISRQLAEVCRSLAAVAGAGEDAPSARPAREGGGASAAKDRLRPTPAEHGEPPSGQSSAVGRRGRTGGSCAVLVDEREAPVAPIEIRDVRAADGEDASWMGAVQRRLERYAEDRVPFALLLVELLDSERMRAALAPIDACRQLQALERAIAEQLRPADSLLRELDGRYWLLAPDADAAAAHSLAERLAAAARRSGSHRSAPLEVAVGIALCPAHGLDAETLIGHADVDLYAAQAAGRSVGGFESDRSL